MASKSRVDTVIFDWDGTIVDSAQSAFRAFQMTFRDLGVPIEWDVYRRIFSPDWYRMYRALGLPEEKWREADELWLRHYGDQIPDVIDGAERVLRDLGAAGYALGVVSSGNRSRVLREIEGLGFNGTFKVVVCDEDVTRKKPDPEGLQIAMARMNRSPGECCYVGDCREDIEMGKRAGVLAVGVLSRFPNSDRIVEADPDVVLESIVLLPGYLR